MSPSRSVTPVDTGGGLSASLPPTQHGAPPIVSPQPLSSSTGKSPVPRPISPKVLTTEEAAAIAEENKLRRAEARALDLNPSTVRIPRITLRGVELKARLDYAKPAETWHVWNEELREALGKCSARRFITGDWPLPDTSIEPASHNNFLLGDEAVLALITSSIQAVDKDWLRTQFPKGATSALAYNALCLRYTHQGTAAQIRLLVAALQLRFGTAGSHLDKLSEIRRTSEAIFAQGKIDVETFALLIAHNAMHGSLTALRNECDSVIAQNNFTTAFLEKRLAALDEAARASTSAAAAPAEVALPASVAPAAPAQPARKTSKYHCDNCGRGSHPKQYCARSGGGYDGWDVEVARAAQKAWEQGQPEPPRPAKKKEQAARGGAQAHVASQQPASPGSYAPPQWYPYPYPPYPPPPTPQQQPAAFAAYGHPQGYTQSPPAPSAQQYPGTGYSMPPPGLFNDAPPPGSYWGNSAWVAASGTVIPLQMPCIETDKSFALFHENPSAKIDWRFFSRTPSAFQAYAAPVHAQGTRPVLSLTDNPFFLDSGATAHISPERGDFIELAPITPRPVAGVGGTVIMATGMGTIRLRIARGAQLVLHNVLFVPAASVRLISVLALGVHSDFTAHFNKSSCWITDRSNRLIVAGNLFRNQLYALRLAPSTATVHAMPVRTRTPDIETWHGRFGHGATHRAVVEAARNRTLHGKTDSRVDTQNA